MVKATVIGAAGGIGQPLSLLLKQNTLVTDLALYDVCVGGEGEMSWRPDYVGDCMHCLRWNGALTLGSPPPAAPAAPAPLSVNAPGVAADISHINTPSVVKGFLPAEDGLQKALKDSDIVVIPAGVPRKPGMTRDDLFNVCSCFLLYFLGQGRGSRVCQLTVLPPPPLFNHCPIQINASIVRDIAVGIAAHAPKAFVLVISNPVNSTVPIVAEVLKKKGVFDPKRLFGVTTLDVVRASTFASEAAGKPTEVRRGEGVGSYVRAMFPMPPPVLIHTFMPSHLTL